MQARRPSQAACPGCQAGSDCHCREWFRRQLLHMSCQARCGNHEIRATPPTQRSPEGSARIRHGDICLEESAENAAITWHPYSKMCLTLRMCTCTNPSRICVICRARFLNADAQVKLLQPLGHAIARAPCSWSGTQFTTIQLLASASTRSARKRSFLTEPAGTGSRGIARCSSWPNKTTTSLEASRHHPFRLALIGSPTCTLLSEMLWPKHNAFNAEIHDTRDPAL